MQHIAEEQQEAEHASPIISQPETTPGKVEHKENKHNTSTVQQPESKLGCAGNLLYAINTPWLLISVPLVLGAIWIANNTWIITNNLDKPYALLAGPAFIGSILAGWLVITFFKTIASWCRQAWQAFLRWKQSDGSTFWMVIAIFLIVSVTESGNYFNGLLGSNDLFGTLGYASAFVIDLVAVECMRARLGAARMRDKVGKQLYLFGVIACAGLSAFANTYTALEHFAEPTNTLLPLLMIKAAPWTGMAFPLLIIFLSFTADYTADQTSSKLDPENYEKQEKTRIRLLEIQRDMLKQRVKIEQEIDRLSGQFKIGKQERMFFLISWLFPKQPANAQQIAAQVTEEIQGEIGKQLQSLYNQFHQEIGQAYQAAITQNTTQIQGIEKSVGQVEFDLNLLIQDWQNYKNIMTIDTLIDQVKSRESHVNMRTNGGLHTHEIAGQFTGNGRQSGQKSLTFTPTSTHKKALEFLQKHLDWQAQFADIIRSNPDSGFKQIAAFLRHNGLNHPSITGPFVAEVLSLLQLTEEASKQREQPTRGQKVAKTPTLKTTHREPVNSMNGPEKPVSGREPVVTRHPSVSPGEHIHEEETPVTSSSEATDHQASKEQEQTTKDPETDHEQVAITSNVPTTLAPEILSEQEHISAEIAANMPSARDQNTEAIEALTPKITGQLPSNSSSDGQENTHGFSEGFSSELETPFSTNAKQFSTKSSEEKDQIHTDFPEQEIRSEPSIFTNLTEDEHARGHELGDNFATDEADIPDELSANSEYSTKRGPYHLTAQEIAEKYHCSLDQVKNAVEQEQLRLSNRTEKERDPLEEWKILTSSLEGWTPPKKRGRPKKQESVLETVK
jgi:hypothetical protein